MKKGAGSEGSDIFSFDREDYFQYISTRNISPRDL